jgi:hypothetical protein
MRDDIFLGSLYSISRCHIEQSLALLGILQNSELPSFILNQARVELEASLRLKKLEKLLFGDRLGADSLIADFNCLGNQFQDQVCSLRVRLQQETGCLDSPAQRAHKHCRVQFNSIQT